MGVSSLRPKERETLRPGERLVKILNREAAESPKPRKAAAVVDRFQAIIDELVDRHAGIRDLNLVATGLVQAEATRDLEATIALFVRYQTGQTAPKVSMTPRGPANSLVK